MHPRVGTALVAALLLTPAGCSDDPEPQSGPAPTRTTQVARVPLLDWTATGGTPEDRRIVGAEWTSLVSPDGAEVTFDGPERVVVPARGGRVISEVLMDDDWAVAVSQDEQETRPSIATVVDLASGETHRVTRPPPGSGGSWAMYAGRLRYATYDRAGDYCLADVDVASGTGDLGYCAPRRHGFSRVSMGAAGNALMTFDDARPVACRTLNLHRDDRLVPVEGAEPCTGWDVAATPDGAIWSTVADERRSEEGEFFASAADGGVTGLGPGTTGTLTTCGDSAFFVRDPQRAGQPARLMRWTGDTLEVAYESQRGGEAFLAPPSCAGRVLTVSAFAEGGDEQVWAEVP